MIIIIISIIIIMYSLHSSSLTIESMTYFNPRINESYRNVSSPVTCGRCYGYDDCGASHADNPAWPVGVTAALPS